ncbi:YitT family protein [Peribacillus sp. JNUCC41]|uniref:YitT family protein n=1 Tax=Peribacillus sp. JNUCC41 TaxID=2778370 RepID=UPI001780A261|nr:YitT family protein [Brevibacillus sp. JNUCC-41]QOS88789.1 YitT family protein [Brevibacillus sp. JNUCC-41]
MFKGLKVTNVFFILIGSAIFAFGLINFNMQNNLAEGGFTGITLLLYFLFTFDPSITNLVLNIPLFLVGWKLLGRISFFYTMFGVFNLSLFMSIFQRYPLKMSLQDDMILASLFAGLFIGIGLGIIFRNGGTTGGVDIIARLVQKYMGWKIGKTIFLFDLAVIGLSWILYLDYREAMYTLLAVFVGAKVIDFMQEGAYSAKGATIMSNRNSEIAENIMKEMERGVTILKGKGSFSKQELDVLYCVVSRNEIFHLKQAITSIDPHAFVSVSDVHDVMGEGFTLDENKMPI